MKKIHALKGSSTSSSTGVVAYIGSSAHIASTFSPSPSWIIIDLGVTRHMTSMHSVFKTQKISTFDGGIRVVDRNCTPVIGEGYVDVSEHLSLSFVV